MYKHKGCMNGTNLGHWLSQYGNKSDEHFSTYITESDIAKIAAAGMDHVRLPVDYWLFESDENPGVYDEKRVAYIDNLVEWCRKNGLTAVLDLHRAPGFFFGDGDKNCLFTDEKMQERFLQIWRFFAERYQDNPTIVFELLNELVTEDVTPWNDLWQRAVKVIREISPERDIIVGGNYWNSVTELKNLTISDDPHVFYTFHFYLPMMFTHQRAGWMKEMVAYRTPVEYPFNGNDHAAFWHGTVPEDMNRVIDKNYLREKLQPAFEFIEKNHRPLYCGEFGVIANADIESQKRWYADVIDLFSEAGIGHAVWSWRGFASVTDEKNEIIDPEMVKILARE